MPRDLPLANGRLFVSFDSEHAIRDLCWPLLGQENHSMGRMSRLGIRERNHHQWQTDGMIATQRYEASRQVAHTRIAFPDLDLELTEAVHPDHDVFLRGVKVVNRTARTRHLAVCSHQDFVMGGDDAFGCVYFEPVHRALVHYRRNRYLLVSGRTGERSGLVHFSCDARCASDGLGCGGKLESGEPLDRNPVAVGSVDSAAELDLVLPPQGSEVVEFWMALGSSEAEVLRLNQHVRSVGVATPLDETRQRHETLLGSLPAENAAAAWGPTAERDLLMILAHTGANGTILAANDSDTLDPGRETYAYLWPRDGALVAHALDRAGRHEETGKFLRHCANLLPPDGYFLHRYHPDGTPGSCWMPRFQNGEPSLPIQEDETALVLWAMHQRFRMFPSDRLLIEELYLGLVVPAADFLCRHRDQETGLPLPSFDLWEERYGVHTFTCASVVAGLRAAHTFATMVGDGASAERYESVAAVVDAAIDRYLFHRDLNRYARTGYPMTSGYFLDPTLDASLAGLVTLGVRDHSHEAACSTVQQLRTGLLVNAGDSGLARYENDPFLRRSKATLGNPWILTTLWVAEAALLLDPKDRDAATAALDFCARHERASGVLPEQVDPRDGSPVGVAPLTWSHAARLSLILLLRGGPE